ncbi:hypothetical protein [Anaeromyxobacter oryzae]|uniref:Uncharacterized protein n=1 Tax=Anaeromyxobacter oryzae TaxID=2918170 RepID=A0ABN6MKJ1_9BACT|nr:hypothetical protein [Anaeromyxobacter oryzae]BDG01547.1 hypothetical protein AMOR_05430 [Anaeromyxobacter oryzae]
MLPLSDPSWKALKGGYKVPYDASVPLARLEAGDDVWEELWQELHHQGDVGEASYASVPHLVRICSDLPSRDWNVYALVSTIEVERHRKSNPPLPEWVRADYERAQKNLLALGLKDLGRVEDALTIRSILGAVALAKGALKLGTWIAFADESEIDEMLNDRQAWSELYRQDLP